MTYDNMTNIDRIKALETALEDARREAMAHMLTVGTVAALTVLSVAAACPAEAQNVLHACP